jgi:flagellar assembly factor FliW
LTPEFWGVDSPSDFDPANTHFTIYDYWPSTKYESLTLTINDSVIILMIINMTHTINGTLICFISPLIFTLQIIINNVSGSSLRIIVNVNHKKKTSLTIVC